MPRKLKIPPELYRSLLLAEQDKMPDNWKKVAYLQAAYLYLFKEQHRAIFDPNSQDWDVGEIHDLAECLVADFNRRRRLPRALARLRALLSGRSA